MAGYSNEQTSKYNMRGVSYWFFKSVVCGEKLGEKGTDKLADNISELRKLNAVGGLPDRKAFISIMISNIRKTRDHSNLSYSEFESWWDKGVMSNVPLDLVEQQGQLNRGGVVCGHIYDLITSDVSCDDIADQLLDFSEDGRLQLINKTAVAKAIEAHSEQVSAAANKRDPAYELVMKNSDYESFSGMVDDIDEVIQNSWSRIDYGQSKTRPLTPLQKRLVDFTKTVAKAVSTSDTLELLAWMQTAIMHKDFNPSSIVIKEQGGKVDMKGTLENIYEFANHISPVEKDIFGKQKYNKSNYGSHSSRSNSNSGSYKFSKQPSGMPDVFFMEDGELKIAYASTSRDTSIERNQFLRHTIEAGFYNAWIKENLNELERLDNDKVGRTLCAATAALKCDKDSMMWFKSGYNSNDLDNYTAYTKRMLSDIFVQNPAIGKETDVLNIKGAISEFAKMGQVARSVLYVRLVGLKNGERDLNELLSPELGDKDLAQILPKDGARFFTRTCDERTHAFLTKVDLSTVQNPVLRSNLQELAASDEKVLFRGLQRMAYQVTQDTHSEFKIDGDVTSKILNNMKFVTGVANTNTAQENELAQKFMSSLMLATQEPDVMVGLLREMSDVSVVSDATLPNGYGGKLYSTGLYQQERSNIMRIVTSVSNEIRKPLIDGESLDGSKVSSVMERYFGSFSGDCLEMIKKDSLVDLADCLSQVRLADSESTEVVDSMCTATDSANFRVQRSLVSPERKNRMTFKI